MEDIRNLVQVKERFGYDANRGGRFLMMEELSLKGVASVYDFEPFEGVGADALFLVWRQYRGIQSLLSGWK